MRKELKEILTANRVQLVEEIVLDTPLWNRLIAKKILKQDQRDKIQLNNTMDEQIGKLLDLIARGPDQVFEDLRSCLHATNQSHVVNKLLRSSDRSPKPATSAKRCPSVEAAARSKKRPRVDPPKPPKHPSSRELSALRGASRSQECPVPEKETDSDISVSPNSLLRLFQSDFDLLNESESAEDKKQCLPHAISCNLRQHENTISANLVFIEDLLTLLVREECMHERAKQLVLTKEDEDQAGKLIELISKSHLHTYKVFLKFLQCTKQFHLFDMLNTDDLVISSIVKIRVDLYMNSCVYNGLESLRKLYAQVQTDICSEESKISKLLRHYNPRLEALSAVIGSMIIYVWTPCPDASTSLHNACDSGDLRQRIQSVLIDITGTCMYDPRVIVTCIENYDKIQTSLQSKMSSLTLGASAYKGARIWRHQGEVAKSKFYADSSSDAKTLRPLDEKSRDSGPSLIAGFCALLNKVGSISPEIAFHVQDSFAEEVKMERLVRELDLERDKSAKVATVVYSNTGSFDLLLSSLVGVFGNTKYHRLLTPVLGVDGVDETASKRASYLVGMILESKRRFFRNGVEFCIRVVASSQQRELFDVLTNVIGTRWLTLDDPDTLIAADILRLSEMKTNPVRLQVSGLGNAKYYPNVTSLVHAGEITATGLVEVNQRCINITSISFQRVAITRKVLPEITEVLSRIPGLDALCFVDTDVGSASKPADKQSSFSSLFAINVQYLRLSSCGLTSGDVNALLTACGRLRHLDISGNAAVERFKAWSESSLTGLSAEGTSLTADDLIQLAAGSRGYLEFLNASSFSMSPESCYDILTLCPKLKEFYVRGDGLLKALNRKMECSIEHIYLTGSTDIPFDMLKLHPSTTGITLNTRDYFARRSLTHTLAEVRCRMVTLFVDEHWPYNFFKDLVDWRNLTQLWLCGMVPRGQIEIKRLIDRTASLHTVGLHADQLNADDIEYFLQALTRPLTRLWLVVSKKEEYAEVIEETEKRLGAPPGMIQLVTDPDGLYGTYTRESGVFYTHLPDTLPNDFRPVIGRVE